MPVFNDASSLKVGGQEVSRVYRGTVQVWQPPVSVDNPDPLEGLTVSDAIEPGSVGVFGGTSQRTDDIVFSCVVRFPETWTDGCLLEQGGTGQGLYVGVREDGAWLRFRAGDGGTAADAPLIGSSIHPSTSHIDISTTVLPSDGELHRLTWEVDMTTYRLRLWLDNDLLATSDTDGWTAASGFPSDRWAGLAQGPYLATTSIAVRGEPQVLWPGGVGSASDLGAYASQVSSWEPEV
jgi:hypothetical protein